MYASKSAGEANETSVLVLCLLLAPDTEESFPGEKCVMSGFREGTLAQMIPVPTSTTDQLRLETHA